MRPDCNKLMRFCRINKNTTIFVRRNCKMTRGEFIKQSGLALTAFALPLDLSAFKTQELMTDNTNFDVIIIGGSYAGLSAAMALGRSLRQVLIIDSGMPCNRQTPHSHNFLTHDGKAPLELSRLAKQDLEKYKTVTFYRGLAIACKKTESGFEIATDTKMNFSAKKLIFASGINDLFPAIKGFAECWGITIVHCPYCHGYEHRSRNTAIIGDGAKAFHLASLVNNLTDRVTVLTNGKADFTAEQVEKLEKNSIKIIETEIAEILHKNGNMEKVVFKDATRMAFDVGYGIVPFAQQSEIPLALGCELTEHGHLKINPFQATTVEGVYACGDNSNMLRSVANAVSSGNIAGAVVNGGLVHENF